VNVIKHHAETPFPLTAGDLAEFVEEMPGNAVVTVKSQMKDYGSQRDPDVRVEPIALCVDWETA
jgi:hypothetical protein